MSYTRDETGVLKIHGWREIYAPLTGTTDTDRYMANIGRLVYQAKHLHGIERSFEEVADVLNEDPTGRIIYGARHHLTPLQAQLCYQAALARCQPPAPSAHREARERNTKPLGGLHAAALKLAGEAARELPSSERKAQHGELAHDAHEEGYTWKDIAAALGLAIDTAKKYAAAHAATLDTPAEVSEYDTAIYDLRLRTLKDDTDLMEHVGKYAMVRARRAAKGMGMPGCNEDLPTPGTGAGQGDMEENPWHTT